jgi:hypothetical protein
VKRASSKALFPQARQQRPSQKQAGWPFCIDGEIQMLLFKHHLWQTSCMGGREPPRKITDYETYFRCAGGTGILREEVWVDAKGKAVLYNLAFLAPHLTRVDNGRILGFDNAHGVHELHFMGEAQPVEFKGFLSTARRFYREVKALRKGFEEKR